ncbi:putative metal-binding protein [Methanomicrobium sp. W14]|uniref:DUF2284 domain-containing protein n=1 Tax=Methanomicrobium sp. W14 TaxID=2817839 RepID=UPI001AE72E64|nr:DUF2284 domain-containing protein [Methanomicrobium sp. W14]MBP2133632.1 putative metal-binding protein [Methanomicrobium sp. W14]
MTGDITELIKKEKNNLGIHEYAFTKPENITFSEDVRKACEKNLCGMYGKSWACPPAVGAIEECSDRCSEYKNAFVFTTLTAIDKKCNVRQKLCKWAEAAKKHKDITEEVKKLFEPHFDKILALSTEGCRICKSCNYPDEPCRFPDRMQPSAEGYGISITKLAKTCGIKYYNGPDTVTYFSIIFF